MSMTVSEASAVNTLLIYVVGAPKYDGDVFKEPTDEQLRDVAAFLAGRVNRAVNAGLTPDAVVAHWSARPRFVATEEASADA